ncbi:MAG TPA: 16S rRNA (adenine(1518)-N(6)/adenine(1519)-N(6))-dimethyltransferase, partial [Flavobacteriaceae bacterium]|nr:16S rRNA (adenine(1518)-N(6)/adenine(1519)-N(6))-dimethyltransferase [Flavobacteriaceae bacterium]
MKSVRPKKKLGQHFLTDLNIAQKIANLLEFENYRNVIEIGPGTGVLTQFLIPKTKDLHLIEIDKESIEFLAKNYPSKD